MNIFNLYQDSTPIAVLSYTTASGEITPLHYKYQTDSGDIITVQDMYIYNSEKLSQSGMSAIIYYCKVIDNNIKRDTTIIYNIERHTWHIRKDTP